MGWSREQFAAELGVSRRTWILYEAGSIPCGEEKCDIIRELTNLEPRMLAYLFYANFDNLPPRLRDATLELQRLWAEELEAMRTRCQRMPG